MHWWCLVVASSRFLRLNLNHLSSPTKWSRYSVQTDLKYRYIPGTLSVLRLQFRAIGWLTLHGPAFPFSTAENPFHGFAYPGVEKILPARRSTP